MGPMSYRPFTSSAAEMPTTVAGSGFTLRRPTLEDAPPLGELVGDPERAEAVVEGWAQAWDADGYGTWVVEGEGGELLGFVGLRPRTDDITVTVRSNETAARDGRARGALRRAVAHGIEWFPDKPLRMRVPARERVVDLWMRVNEAGGAVGFVRDATRADVEEEMERRALALQSGALKGVALMSPVGDLLGIGFLRRPTTSLMAQVRNVEAVMVEPERRGLSLGRHLMGGIHRVAREEGVEILTLDYRDGLGLGDFYEGVGYSEVGRFPRLIRVAEGDDRDGVAMMRRID